MKWGLSLDDVDTTWWRLAERLMNAVTDPEDHERLRRRYMHAWKTRDLQKMGRTLGVQWLAAIALNKQTRSHIDPHYVPTLRNAR